MDFEEATVDFMIAIRGDSCIGSAGGLIPVFYILRGRCLPLQDNEMLEIMELSGPGGVTAAVVFPENSFRGMTDFCQNDG